MASMDIYIFQIPNRRHQYEKPYFCVACFKPFENGPIHSIYHHSHYNLFIRRMQSSGFNRSQLTMVGAWVHMFCWKLLAWFLLNRCYFEQSNSHLGIMIKFLIAIRDQYQHKENIIDDISREKT